MMLSPLSPFRLAVLKADILDAVRSSHISDGDTADSLIPIIKLSALGVVDDFHVEDQSRRDEPTPSIAFKPFYDDPTSQQ
jgi:hypothetical protein